MIGFPPICRSSPPWRLSSWPRTYLVQFPVQGMAGGIALADILTWGAFTYPFAFLVTDLANRRYGPGVARRVVFVGFMIAVVCSIAVPPLLYRNGPDRIRRRAPAGWCASPRLPARRSSPRSCSTSPSSTGCAGKAGGARRCSPRWPARCSTPRSSSRSPSRRCSPSSGPRMPSRWSRRRCSGVFSRGGLALGVVGDRRPVGEAGHRRVRADPLPADRRALEPAGGGVAVDCDAFSHSTPGSRLWSAIR